MSFVLVVAVAFWRCLCCLLGKLCGDSKNLLVPSLLWPQFNAEPQANIHMAKSHLQVSDDFKNACAIGDVDTVELLLQRKGHEAIDPNADFGAAITQACWHGQNTIVSILLSLQGDRAVHINQYKDGPFRAACSGGHMAVVQTLLALTGDRAVDVNAEDDDAFRSACAKGHVDIVALLLALEGHRRVDIHACNEDGFRRACRHNQLQIVQLLLAQTGDREVDVHAKWEEAFRDACKAGHTAVVCELLQLQGTRAIDVNARQGYALASAGYFHHWDVFDALISHARSSDQSSRYPLRLHPQLEQLLGRLTAKGDAEAVQKLLSLQGDAAVDVLYDAEAALKTALKDGHFRIARLLLLHRLHTSSQLPHLLAHKAAAYSEEIAASLRACGCASDGAVARAVEQCVLVSAARKPSESLRLNATAKQVLTQYCVTCAALPASGHAPLRSLLQQQQASSRARSQEQAALAPTATAPQAWQDHMGMCLADLVWCGVSIPVSGRMFDSHSCFGSAVGQVLQGLHRVGRRAIVLHRAAVRSSVSHHKAGHD